MRRKLPVVGEDPEIKLPSLAFVLGISAYWLAGTPADVAPPNWMVSIMAWVGLVFLMLTLIPANVLRFGVLPDWRKRLTPIAQRRRTLGLMTALWFWGHYNLAVKLVRSSQKAPSEIQAQYDPVLDTGQIALFIFLLLFLTSYKWSRQPLKGDWKRLQSLVWVAVPLILVHSISAKWAFEQQPVHVSLAMLLSIIGFAGYEAVRLGRRRHPDRWRHVLLIAVGLVIALYYRFLFR
jgi:DMSO/TMAO reductase YedYZ heme-binding membrane subunit